MNHQGQCVLTRVYKHVDIHHPITQHETLFFSQVLGRADAFCSFSLSFSLTFPSHAFSLLRSSTYNLSPLIGPSISLLLLNQFLYFNNYYFSITLLIGLRRENLWASGCLENHLHQLYRSVFLIRYCSENMRKKYSGGAEDVSQSSDLRFSLHFGSTDHILGILAQPGNLPLHHEHRGGVSHSLRVEMVWPPHLTFSRVPAPGVLWILRLWPLGWNGWNGSQTLYIPKEFHLQFFPHPTQSCRIFFPGWPRGKASHCSHFD